MRRLEGRSFLRSPSYRIAASLSKISNPALKPKKRNGGVMERKVQLLNSRYRA